ncbi:hypothetical protein [Endozoicomonas sp. SCSIO W0465]|uniref:hypothetical protein n=1 Tax=Endozoicomonas sp. SCSIO W0465 TaxID=2918516 RepID=UPI002075946E|nr:hypothetical protein [Endozoicomonas sp. SCSIO W0465]USE38481.1 hypothetical protein MJO57_10115 [Endozoicomonas sp. SCSIO W0465]
MTIDGPPPSPSFSPHHAARCNEPEASALSFRTLTNQATYSLTCIYDIARYIPNPAYYITRALHSSPGAFLTLLTLAGKCVTAVNASPYTPSSVNPSPTSAATASSSATIPSAPPYIPPPPRPGWMPELNNNDNPPENPAHNGDNPVDEQISHAIIDRPPPIENRCIEKNLFFPPPRYSMVCLGTEFPAHQTRNFHSEYLSCKNAEYTYSRHPDPDDLAVWRARKDLPPETVTDRLRQSANPQKSATFSYPTELFWRWEQCQPILDSLICGTYEVCEVTERTTRTGRGHQKRAQSRRCRNLPRTCYADVPVLSHQRCGQGKIDFSVEFLKKDLRQHHPGYQGYDGIMPKGYELLPGEKETIAVTISSTSGRLLPKLDITDARNRYTPSLSVRDPEINSLQCRQDGYDRITFTVETGNRILSNPPNILSFPDHSASNAIIWGGELDVNGMYDARGYPRGLTFQTSGLPIFDAIMESVSGNARNAALSVKVELYEPGLLWGEWLRSTAYFNQHNLQCRDGHTNRSEWTSICELRFDQSPGDMIFHSQLPGVVYPLINAFCYFVPGGCSDKTPFFRNDLIPGDQYTFKVSTSVDLPFYHHESFSRNSLDIPVEANPKIDLRTWQPFFWNVVRSAQYTALFVGAYGLVAIAVK